MFWKKSFSHSAVLAEQLKDLAVRTYLKVKKVLNKGHPSCDSLQNF